MDARSLGYGHESHGADEIHSRHPLSQRFHDVLKEIGDLHDKKQLDYGRQGDPFSNIRGSADWGVTPWVGAMVRANDKLKRLQKFAACGCLANEAVEDSFKDLAVYALIGFILYEEEQRKTQPELHPHPNSSFMNFIDKAKNDLLNINESKI